MIMNDWVNIGDDIMMDNWSDDMSWNFSVVHWSSDMMYWDIMVDDWGNNMHWNFSVVDWSCYVMHW